MAYGDYDGHNKANKGHEGGACNRTRCQAEPARFWNHGSYSWYCADCAEAIGQDPMNKRDWETMFQPRLGHPMFETREQIDARKRVSREDAASVDTNAKRQDREAGLGPKDGGAVGAEGAETP